MKEVRKPRLADHKSGTEGNGFHSYSSTGHRIDLSEFGFQGSTIDLEIHGFTGKVAPNYCAR